MGRTKTILAVLAVMLAPLIIYVSASAAVGPFQWRRDHVRCDGGTFDRSVSACLYRREHERGGLFHAWGSNFRAED